MCLVILFPFKIPINIREQFSQTLKNFTDNKIDLDKVANKESQTPFKDKDKNTHIA